VDPWQVFVFLAAAYGAVLGIAWFRRLVGLMGPD
jgi:hypothetical protein